MDTLTQETHLRLMRAVASEMATAKGVYVLKGGTALMFTRGLDRFSTDLDYDGAKRLSLVGALKTGAGRAGVTVSEVEILKDSDVMQTYRMRYVAAKDVIQSLLVETRIREIDFAETEKTKDGLLVYKPHKQLAQKLEAAADRGNRAPRDLYDIAFLVEKYPEAAVANAEKLKAFASNPDLLLHIYSSTWRYDEILGEKPLESVILGLMESMEKALKQEISIRK